MPPKRRSMEPKLGAWRSASLRPPCASTPPAGHLLTAEGELGSFEYSNYTTVGSNSYPGTVKVSYLATSLEGEDYFYNRRRLSAKPAGHFRKDPDRRGPTDRDPR